MNLYPSIYATSNIRYDPSFERNGNQSTMVSMTTPFNKYIKIEMSNEHTGYHEHYDFTPRYEYHHHRVYWAIIKVHIQCTQNIYRYGTPFKKCRYNFGFILKFTTISPVSFFFFLSCPCILYECIALVSIFHFHHVCVTDIFLRMLFISLVERIRFNYVTSLLWVTPIGPPPMLMRLVSWNRLQQRNKFMHALRKPRFMKQYVIGLQQLDE